MTNSRRDFLKSGTGLMAATGVIGAPMALHAGTAAAAGEMTEHELPPLPYDYDALEPYIDEETMRLHHGKHHQGYVNGLNKAEAALAAARDEGDYDYVQFWSRKAAFTGGGHFLHSMFWKVMAPAGNGGGGEPQGELAEMIERDFGGFDEFKAHFSAAAGAVEGSGWGLLHFRPGDGRLVVLQAENQHKLSPWGVMPVLGIDVWEHAYYVKYRNRRGDYIKAWWNVVNWAQVARNVEALKQLA
jgi:Fe-Mn family superoxide dismutase